LCEYLFKKFELLTGKKRPLTVSILVHRNCSALSMEKSPGRFKHLDKEFAPVKESACRMNNFEEFQTQK
jgi:hypothetical protein